jgi:hypothetical protein
MVMVAMGPRLDHLPHQELAVIGKAAVIGKRFGASEVVELSPQDEQPAVLVIGYHFEQAAVYR